MAAKTLLYNAPTGEFTVNVIDAQEEVGGLWPTTPGDDGRLVHPFMVANQSRHTMHFSDMAWEDGSPQFPVGWQVGNYLKQYQKKYLSGKEGYKLQLGTRITSVLPRGIPEKGWDVVLKNKDQEEKRAFDYVLVATGFFCRPIIPESLNSSSAEIPVVHSSAYRDLKGLLKNARHGGGKILIVGGQMSGVEIAGTIASHLSAATHSPDGSDIPDVDKYSIHHVVQRPIWVFPLHTTPEVSVVTLFLTVHRILPLLAFIFCGTIPSTRFPVVQPQSETSPPC